MQVLGTRDLTLRGLWTERSPEELAEWNEPVRRLAEEAERTWVMFNNCKYDYAPRNARELAEILGPELVAPWEGACAGQLGLGL